MKIVVYQKISFLCFVKITPATLSFSVITRNNADSQLQSKIESYQFYFIFREPDVLENPVIPKLREDLDTPQRRRSKGEMKVILKIYPAVDDLRSLPFC